MMSERPTDLAAIDGFAHRAAHVRRSSSYGGRLMPAWIVAVICSF
jgi:hypothetical protein